jgi:hypothetical protein
MCIKTGIRIIGAVLLIALGSCTDEPVAPPEPPVSTGEPYVFIEQPSAVTGTPLYTTYTNFRWRDGEGAPTRYTRHLFGEITDTLGNYNPGFDMLGDLNENPWRYDTLWSAWKAIDAPDGSGRATVIGDDEELTIGRYYILAVQSKDARDSLTTLFDRKINARIFGVTTVIGPALFIHQPILKGMIFFGTLMNPLERDYPSGAPLCFTWKAEADDYGGEIMGYRYGWDIPDPGSWDSPFDPACTTSVEVSFYAGIHTLFVEALDQAGKVTRGRVEITIVPFPMDRSLLWVDDFPSADFTQVDWSIPTETQHDEFWIDICSRADGFDPAQDIYDTQSKRLKPPSLERLGGYKNVIWTYSSSFCTWEELILFVPEEIAPSSSAIINYLPVFLSKGGHVWTLGRSDKGGGLAAALEWFAQVFPMSLECELSGNSDECDEHRSGAQSMPYRDYCVTMLDKIQANFRTEGDMPLRWLYHYDVMTHAYRDDLDYYTASRPGMPERLELWEEVTAPGRYFDPDSSATLGGFTYVEIYDPAYWMDYKSTYSQPCFHPIYRMKAKNGESVLNDCTIALWITRYDEIVPAATSGTAVAAPSLHFGFPLWFFARSQVDSIVQVVFDEWGIAAE